MAGFDLDADAFLKGLARALADLERDAAQELVNTADAVVDRAKALCPVDTGHLRDSLEARVLGDGTVEVGTDDPTGIYNEFGTSKMPPRQFMRPALAEAPRDFGKGIR